MTIIVEDGTAKSDAQTYCSVAFADAWHLARGITLWATMSEAEKEACLVRAAAEMVSIYRLRWMGERVTSTQALDWPRYEVPRRDVSDYVESFVESDEVPIEVQQANAELGFKAAFGDLTPDQGQKVQREKVDVIEVEYAPGSTQTKRYVRIERMLAPFLRDGGGLTMQVLRS